MPGLLNVDPNAAGLIALGGGMVRGDFGGGLLGFSQATQDAQKNLVQQQLAKAQMDNLASEVETRKAALAKQQQINDLLTRTLGGGAPQPSPVMPGQLGSGSFGVVPPPAGQPSIPQPQGTAAPSGSRIGSMPLDTLALLKANGLDLVDVAKLGRPDMQVNNGYAYDKNNLPPGFLPQFNVSRDGQASLTQIGPDGLPVVSAPRGALDTYSSFRNADEAAKAGLDLVKVVGPDGAERYVTRAQAAQATQPPAPRAMGPRPMGSSPADADRYAILTQELARAQASGNQGDVAAIQREIAALPASARTGASPSGLATMPLQASPTTAQAAQRAKLLKQAETDVRPTEQRQNEIASSNYMLSVIDRALNHPGLSEATGLQGTLDPRNYIPGTQAKDFQAIHDQITGNTFLQAYANLKGGGSITEVEGKKATDAIARLNRAQSTDAYRSALSDLRSVVTSALERQKMNLSAAPVAYQGNGASGSFAGDNSQMVPKQTLNELPKSAARGARVRDTQTGKVLQFNGMSWVEVK